MDFLNKLWDAFQGYKTAIGGIIFYLLSEQWFLNLLPDGTTEDTIVGILTLIAKVFLGVGIGDKIYKFVIDKTYNDLKKETE